jgi:hypothetical protein
MIAACFFSSSFKVSQTLTKITPSPLVMKRRVTNRGWIKHREYLCETKIEHSFKHLIGAKNPQNCSQRLPTSHHQDSLRKKTLSFSYLQRRHLVRVLGSGERAGGGQERAVPGVALGSAAGPEEAARRLSEPAPRSWAGPLNFRKFILYH